MPIGNGAPTLTGTRSRTDHLVGLPINGEAAVIKARGRLGLPAHVWGVLATWDIRLQRAGLTTTLALCKGRFFERIADVASTRSARVGPHRRIYHH